MKKIYLIIFVAFGFSITSCEFGDTNINPALPSDVSGQAIVPAAQAGMAFNVGGEMVRINALFMQQFQGINAQQFDNYKYLVKASDMDGLWRRAYHDALNALTTIQRKADEQSSNHTSAMTEILIAHTLGSLADMFGDIPYSDALKGLDGEFFAAYDSQEQIYNTIQSLTDGAIAKLNGDAGSGPGLGSDDLIFGGDTDAWVKSAYAIKAKYYLHASKVDSEAYSKALSALANGISSNAEDFQFNFGSSTNEANPQYQFTQDRGGNLAIDPYFFNLLIGLDDPRNASLLEASSTTPSGFNTNFNSGTFYTKINSPVIYASYAEAKFIEAEAQLMGNDDVSAAEAALKAGINASISKITGAANDAYAEANGTLTDLGDKNAQLERIMTQKYIALYSHGLEAWVDFRRTGYPAISPVDGGSNAFNLNGEVPRRLPYPQTEIDLNPSNVPIMAPNFQERFWWDL